MHLYRVRRQHFSALPAGSLLVLLSRAAACAVRADMPPRISAVGQARRSRRSNSLRRILFVHRMADRTFAHAVSARAARTDTDRLSAARSGQRSVRLTVCGVHYRIHRVDACAWLPQFLEAELGQMQPYAAGGASQIQKARSRRNGQS